MHFSASPFYGRAYASAGYASAIDYDKLSLAITAGIDLTGIGKTIHPYPHQAEAIKKTGR